ncbi:hypothetical protein HMPREF1142_0943 [Peptostreptococcaceae bacterium AS15]|nr:hypothetical protein HMPREF1142_0943 [Peptostreptococcaceae bacterium AS15]
MKLKKLTSLVLSGAMVFGMAFFAPSKADEVSNSYFDAMKSVATWNKAESKVDLNLNLDLKALGDEYKEFSTDYNLKLDTAIDTEAVLGKLNAKFTSPALKDFKIPELTMFFNKNDFYVNKEVFNMYMAESGYAKQTKKDFVKMTFDKVLAESMGVDANFYKSIMEQSTSKETSEKMFNYLSKIDIGIDMGLTKEGNTYKLDWDSDKLVDITNAYVKYTLKNPETFLNMYKEVYGIDLIAEMKKSDNTMTEEKYKKSMKEALVQWEKEVEPTLPKVKKVIAGSKLSVEENFGKEDYSQKVTFKLALDLNRITEMSEGKKYTKPMVVSATLTSNATSKKMEKVDLTVPTDVEVFDMVKYVKEEDEKLKKDIQKMKDEEKKLSEQGPVFDKEEVKEQETKVEEKKSDKKSTTTTFSETNLPEEKPYKVTLDPNKKELRVYYKGEVAPALKVETKTEKGVVYLPTEMMEDEVLMKEIDTAEMYVPFKSTMEKNGYTVAVDSKTGVLTATTKKAAAPTYPEEKPYKVTIKPSTKELRVYFKGEVAPALKVESKVVKGTLYLPTEMMEDEVLMKQIDTAESYVPFKATMEKNGYKVYWDKKTKTTVAELKK